MVSRIQGIIILAAAAGCILTGDLRISCFLLSGCILLLFAASFYSDRKREKQLEELISYLMKVQDGMELPDLTKCKEGQIGILQNEIYKLVVLLKQQLGSVTREKTYLADMLSDISHQIKTPLTAITIMTDLLKQPDLPVSKRLEFVENADRQVNKITWLIQNLLTLSRLEADMLKFQKESVEMHGLLENVCGTLELLAEVRGVSLQLPPYKEAIFAVCDPAWTAEAFSNILKNCVEHTSQGGTVQILLAQNNFGTTVTIKDTGDGIAKEDLPHIFERFYKGKHSAKDSVGIGLAMAKQIMMRQNGVIHVESTKGEGSIFDVRIYKKAL